MTKHSKLKMLLVDYLVHVGVLFVMLFMLSPTFLIHVLDILTGIEWVLVTSAILLGVEILVDWAVWKK